MWNWGPKILWEVRLGNALMERQPRTAQPPQCPEGYDTVAFDTSVCVANYTELDGVPVATAMKPNHRVKNLGEP